MAQKTIKDVDLGETVPIEGTEQERIPALETVAKKFAEKRRELASLAKLKKTALAKLDEKLEEVKDQLADNGDGTYSYVRGGFKLILKEKHSIECEVPGEEVAEK